MFAIETNHQNCLWYRHLVVAWYLEFLAKPLAVKLVVEKHVSVFLTAKDVMKYEPLRAGFTVLDLKEQVYHRRVR